VMRRQNCLSRDVCNVLGCIVVPIGVSLQIASVPSTRAGPARLRRSSFIACGGPLQACSPCRLPADLESGPRIANVQAASRHLFRLSVLNFLFGCYPIARWGIGFHMRQSWR
jgi:hypothetical protein